MRKKYQVFVSSTYEDLIEERKRATQEIMKAGCIPAGMELFPAANDDQWRLIQNAIDESDFYVVISAGRYGTETKTPDGEIISYTEMEFDYAIKTGKYIIGLLHSDIESLPAKYSEKSDEKRKRLDGFHRKIKDGREVSFWKTGDELSASLAHALYYAKENSSCPGWLRAENEPDSLPLSNDSIDEYESKIKNLENQVSTLSKKIEDGAKDYQICQEGYCKLLAMIDVASLGHPDCQHLLYRLDEMVHSDDPTLQALAERKLNEIKRFQPEAYEEFIDEHDDAQALSYFRHLDSITDSMPSTQQASTASKKIGSPDDEAVCRPSVHKACLDQSTFSQLDIGARKHIAHLLNLDYSGEDEAIDAEISLIDVIDTLRDIEGDEIIKNLLNEASSKHNEALTGLLALAFADEV